MLTIYINLTSHAAQVAAFLISSQMSSAKLRACMLDRVAETSESEAKAGRRYEGFMMPMKSKTLYNEGV